MCQISMSLLLFKKVRYLALQLKTFNTAFLKKKFEVSILNYKNVWLSDSCMTA